LNKCYVDGTDSNHVTVIHNILCVSTYIRANFVCCCELCRRKITSRPPITFKKQSDLVKSIAFWLTLCLFCQHWNIIFTFNIAS